MSKSVAAGDILEVSCDGALGYASYAGRHPWLGDAMWLAQGSYPTPTTDWGRVFTEPGFIVFYPVHASLRQKLIRKVGYAIEAIRPAPEFVRNPVETDTMGHAISWLVTDGVSRYPRLDSELTAAERELPIGAIWNHKLLCERIRSGWHP
jgi:hypothetical protein